MDGALVSAVFILTLFFWYILHSTSSSTTFKSTLIIPCYNLLRPDRLKENRMERQKSAKERRQALRAKWLDGKIPTNLSTHKVGTNLPETNFKYLR